MSNQPHDETFELALILIDVKNANTRTRLLLESGSISPKAKHWMHMHILGKLNAIEKDVKGAFDKQGVQLLEADTLNPHTARQAKEVNYNFLMLEQEDRDKVEAFMESLKEKEAVC
jgi:hypothetical protein